MRSAEDANGLIALLDDIIRRHNRVFWITAIVLALAALLLGYSIWDGWEMPG